MELLRSLRAILEVNQELNPEDKKLIMRLSAIYEERLAEATRKGELQGERQVVVNLLRVRSFLAETPTVDSLDELDNPLESKAIETLLKVSFQSWN